jgi:hypothetical protein
MRRLALLSVIVLALAPAATAQKFAMKAAPVVPSAKGEVKISHDRNGNTKVDLKVDHLAQPDRLTPPKTAYVVWIQGDNKQPENKGQLTVSGDLKGQLTTLTSSRTFDIFITAEDNAQAPAPSGPEVLRTTVQG